jgi:hypothetical protein
MKEIPKLPSTIISNGSLIIMSGVDKTSEFNLRQRSDGYTTVILGMMKISSPSRTRSRGSITTISCENAVFPPRKPIHCCKTSCPAVEEPTR